MPYQQRGRPAEFENLRNITLSCDTNLIRQAKNMNINISEILRSALSYAVNNPIYKEIDEIEKRLNNVSIFQKRKIKRSIMNDKTASRNWKKWLEINHHIEVTEEELLKWVGY